jgi:hypothetical protein
MSHRQAVTVLSFISFVLFAVLPITALLLLPVPPIPKVKAGAEPSRFEVALLALGSPRPVAPSAA